MHHCDIHRASPPIFCIEAEQHPVWITNGLRQSALKPLRIAKEDGVLTRVLLLQINSLLLWAHQNQEDMGIKGTDTPPHITYCQTFPLAHYSSVQYLTHIVFWLFFVYGEFFLI